MISFPTPGQLNIVSVTTAKASVEPSSSPKTVMIGIEISFKRCRLKIVTSEIPAALANLIVSVSIISRVPALASRIIIESLKSARFIAGRMMCDKPVKVGKDQSIPKISTVGPRPPAGNQPKLTANVSISINY